MSAFTDNETRGGRVEAHAWGSRVPRAVTA
jgi:hypothetical protein